MEKVSVAEAAERLGKSAQFVRIGLQRKLIPIGTAVQMPGGRWSYYISPGLLEDYICGSSAGSVAGHQNENKVYL